MSQFPPKQPPQQPYNQGQPPYPPQQPYLPPVKPKKPFYKRVWFVILAGLVLIIIIASLANGGKDSPAGGGATVAGATETAQAQTAQTSEAPAEKTKEVVLSATASGAGHVIWGLDGGSNAVDFSESWTLTVPYDDANMITMSVTGDFMGSDDQQIACVITDAGGKQLDQASGSGAGGSAFCSAFIH